MWEPRIKLSLAGLSHSKTQDITNQVKSQLEEKENQKFPVFKAVSFKSQVVAGTNFFIKVNTGGKNFMHLWVFRNLPHEKSPLTLLTYKTNKAKHNELNYSFLSFFLLLKEASLFYLVSDSGLVLSTLSQQFSVPQ
uniref:Cystatin-B n=1 Tax=Spermophilus dauricus TaxID=99837 RepID=A0A8C9PJS2_SPEDA